MTDANVQSEMMLDKLRTVTGVFEVTCSLPPLTRKVNTTTKEVNDAKGTRGEYTHSLLPASIVSALTTWSNAARYMRKAHGGLLVGDRYLVPLSKIADIEKDILAKQQTIDRITAQVESKWDVVTTYVNDVLGALDEPAVMLYGDAAGLEVFKKHIAFDARVVPLPPSGVDAIPAAFAGEQHAQVINHLQIQDAEFRKSVVQSLSADFEELKKRIDDRIVWLAAGGVGDAPRPRVTARFVTGISSRAEVVNEISNGLMPEIAAVCSKWEKVYPVLLDNLEHALGNQATCQTLSESLGSMLASANT